MKLAQRIEAAALGAAPKSGTRLAWVKDLALLDVVRCFHKSRDGIFWRADEFHQRTFLLLVAASLKDKP